MINSKKRNTLNEKELEILKLISGGYASSDISKELKLSIGTIDNYVKNMLLKTNTVNRAHLVYEALKRKIIK